MKLGLLLGVCVVLLLGGCAGPRYAASQLVLDDTAEEFGVGRIRSGAIEPEGVRLRPAGEKPDAYLSAVLTPAMSFDQVLLSFNADVPPGAGLWLEVRVSESEAGSDWSPWLHVAEWGDVRPETRVKDFDGGKVDVDYLVSRKPLRRCQYRLTAGGAPGLDVLVRRVGICFSDTTGRGGGVIRPPDTGDSALRLAVPFRSQRTERGELAGRLCSPTSVSMVLAHHGADHPVALVASLAHDPAEDIYGNWPRNIQAAHSLGVPGHLTRFTDWGWVRHHLARGRPIVASIRVGPGELPGAPYEATDGHLVVITGLDRNVVWINDPAASDPAAGTLALDRRRFERVWFGNTHGTCYVFGEGAD